MLKINRDITIAITICHYLRKMESDTISGTILADLCSVSEDYMLLICGKLANAGLIISIKGRGGGYSIKDKINVLQIFNALGYKFKIEGNEIVSKLKKELKHVLENFEI